MSDEKESNDQNELNEIGEIKISYRRNSNWDIEVFNLEKHDLVDLKSIIFERLLYKHKDGNLDFDIIDIKIKYTGNLLFTVIVFYQIK
jgi:hypothetical protein